MMELSVFWDAKTQTWDLYNARRRFVLIVKSSTGEKIEITIKEKNGKIVIAERQQGE